MKDPGCTLRKHRTPSALPTFACPEGALFTSDSSRKRTRACWETPVPALGRGPGSSATWGAVSWGAAWAGRGPTRVPRHHAKESCNSGPDRTVALVNRWGACAEAPSSAGRALGAAPPLRCECTAPTNVGGRCGAASVTHRTLCFPEAVVEGREGRRV